MYTKRNLNPAQLRQYLACAREMQREGARLDIPEEWIEPCPLKIARATIEGRVFEIDGLTGYVLPVSIVAHGRVIVTDYALYSDLDEIIELPYLRPKKGRYRWGDRDYPAAQILNDKLDDGFRLNFRGDIIEGVILGYGGDFEKAYEGIRKVVVHVSLFDSLDRRAETAIEVPLDAKKVRRQPLHPYSSRTSDQRGLFDEVPAPPSMALPLDSPERLADLSGRADG